MEKKFSKHLFNSSILTGMFLTWIGFSFHCRVNADSSVKPVKSAPTTTVKPKRIASSVVKKNRLVSQLKKQLDVTSQDKSYHVQDVISDMLENSPNIQADLSAKREAMHRIGQAESGYFPVVDLKAGTGFDYMRDKFSTNELNNAVKGTFKTWKHHEASISLTQGLFSGFSTANSVDKANKEVGQAQFKYEETQQLLAFEAGRIFITLRRLGRLVELAQQNISYHQSTLSKVKNLVSAGKNTISDSQHVEGRLSDAQAALQDIKGDYEASISRFIELTGHEPGALASARVPESFLPKSLNAAISEARTRNKSLGIANASIDVAKADLATTDAPFYPSVNIEANAGRNLNVAGETGQQTTVTALVVARYNLFNGFQNIEKTREYIDRVTTAKYRRDAEVRRVEREVRTAWEEMNTAYQQALALERAVANKKDILNSKLGQFDVGASSFAEILNATHEWFLAQGSKITAQASQDIASLKLLATTGRLVELYAKDKKINVQGEAETTALSTTPVKSSTNPKHKMASHQS